MDAAFGPTFRGDRPDERAPTASMDSKPTPSAASPDRHEHASMTLLRLPDVIHAFAVGTATSDGASVQRQDSDDDVSIDVEHGLATDTPVQESLDSGDRPVPGIL
jgi:hypothetical protein